MPQDADIMADASDCRALYEAGSITLADGTAPQPDVGGEVDFGPAPVGVDVTESLAHGARWI